MPFRNPGKTALASLIACLFLAGLWLAGLQSFTRDVMVAAPANARPADAIVALTGGSNRLETGFDLLKNGMGRKLFISGVYRGVDVKDLLDKWKKEDHGGLDCCVVLGHEADDTIGNARETLQWLQDEKYNSIVLVTANYHMARALLVFRTFDPALAITPWPVSPEGLDMADWWRDAPFRDLVVREYNKYLVTIVWSLFS